MSFNFPCPLTQPIFRLKCVRCQTTTLRSGVNFRAGVDQTNEYMKYLGNRRRAIRWPFWCPEAALPFLLIDCYQKIQAVNNFKLQGIKKSTSSTRLPNLNNTKNVILQQQRTETNFAPKRGNAPNCNKSANGAPFCEWTGEGGTLQRLYLLPIFNRMRGVGGEQRQGCI